MNVATTQKTNEKGFKKIKLANVSIYYYCID